MIKCQAIKYVTLAGLLVLGISLACLVAETFSLSTPSTEVIVDNTQKHQKMEGFGATHLALVYEGTGDVLSPDLRKKALKAVYSQVGISMGNLEGALLETPGGWDARTNDNNDPFNFNWKGFQTAMTEAIKKKVVEPTAVLGFHNYYLSQKVNVRWASPWLDDILRKDYDRYLDEVAEQVAAGHIYWRDTYKIVPEYQMLFNEPLSGNQELLNGTVDRIIDIIKRTATRLRREGFEKVKFVIPNEETEENTLKVTRAILADPEARQYVGAIGYHVYPYGSVYANINKILKTSGAGKPDSHRIAVRNQLRDLGKEYGIPIWMTEVSHGEVDSRSFDGFRGRAIHIHDELVHADAAAYFGMNNMWDSRSHELHFNNNKNLFLEEGNIVLIDIPKKTIQITGMGYAIGHYARWLKRGAIRLEAKSNNPLVQITAFIDDIQKKLVLVAINNTSSQNRVNVQLKDLTFKGNLTGEQSTHRAYWQPLSSIKTATPMSFAINLPAESVTTVMGKVS